MTQLDDRPDVQTDSPSRFPELEASGERQSAGRIAVTVLLLAAVMLVAAVVGYVLAGGHLPGRGQATAQAPATAAPTPPRGAAAAAAAAATSAATPTAAPATSQAASAPKPAPTSTPPTAQLQPTAPPPTTAPARPTAPPPTAVPQPTTAQPTPATAAKPSETQPGIGMPIRPGLDARQAQIEGKIREYFDALGDEDYARAQQVCCTAEWRARYPLEQWQRNFNGVSDLRLVGSPRYLNQSDEQVVVDTDYTFVSGGARRNFTLRWTFHPVGSEWQADLAEAFPTE
jgi:hypothetical protein